MLESGFASAETASLMDEIKLRQQLGLRFQRIGDRQTPPQPWTSPQLSKPVLGPCCPGPDCDAMEPHGVDSVCLVGRLRSAPVMAARFGRSSVLKCPLAKAVSRQV